MLRNRKTNETFTYEQGALKSTSLFAKKDDPTQFNEFINQFVYKFTKNISTNDKQKIIQSLRKMYSESDVIKEIDKNPEEFKRLIIELKQQMKNLDGKKSDSTSISNFFNIIGTSLINAQLNSVFPGLAVFTSLFGAAAAQSYTYFQGMPEGGKDLCDEALGECIQGYLTEMNETWTPDMPQISRDFVGSTNASKPCIMQNDMESMLRRAFRPNNDTINCTIPTIVEKAGNATVTATSLDQIGCNLLEDSTVGIATKCGSTKQPFADNYLGPIVIGGTAGLLIMAYTAYSVYQCSQIQKQENDNVRINEGTSLV